MNGWRYIHIRNWESFQHKDLWKKSGGHPPWIKLYTKLLHDDEYRALSHAQRSTLHGLWIMYASSGRGLRDDTSKISDQLGVRVLRKTLDALNHAGFIEYSSQQTRNSVAPRAEESREEKTAIDETESKDARREIESGLATSRLLNELGAMDLETQLEIRMLCGRASEAVIAKILESLAINASIRNRVGYALTVLRAEVAA